ncbi:Phage-related minor tail protein [Pseudodesulfovibrio hydrargyri]|uniref:Phage-related minor tail protein n=1 Tax=Pseudodesulfovibrio hydrargyri TaxID=2125990 RepID=A0A1J5MYF6_9BACT|nr:phage tail tape measure protein [Pseudodesulfovibrio hydrargyri]OIQ51034.1 Phage-related minor tail protein [Pseudodesulfovibrio hydrargyri]
MDIFNITAPMFLVDMISASLKIVVEQMKAAAGAAGALGSRALGLAKSLLPVAQAGRNVLGALTPYIATAADFEAAMSDVGAVSRATPIEMRALSGAARELGASTGWSAMQVAEGQKYLALAGFSVKENLAALPGVLNGLTAPSAEAARSMAALGVAATDATGDLRSPAAILDAIAQATENMGSAQKAAFAETVFGTESMGAALALFDQAGTGGIAEYGRQMTAAGTAAEAAARRNDNLIGDQKALGSAFESLQITIGSLFLPVMRLVAQAATWVVRGLNMIAASPVGQFLLSAVASMATAVVAITYLSGAVETGIAVWAAFNAMISANPIGLIVLAVVGLVAGLIALYNNCDKVREIMDAVWEWIKALASAVGDFFSILSGAGVLGVFAYYFTDIYNAVGALWDRLTSLFDMDLTEMGRKLILSLVDGIKAVAMAPYNAVKGVFGKMWSLFAHSDADEGPLANLTNSGMAVMNTLGSGIRAAAPNLHATTATALAGVAVAANLAVAPPAPSSIQGPAPVPAHAPAPDRATVHRSGNTITIQHLSMTLPGVRDADGFMAALQQLVTQHDGSGPESGGFA